jgi:hypothetical protein
MALRKPLVLGADGNPQQLQSTDTLSGSFAENNTISLTNGDATSHALGNLVYVSAASTVKKAQANAAGTSKAIAFATGTIANGAVGSYQTSGTLAGLSGLVAGSVYFLDPAAAGGMTVTVPSTAGQYVVRVGTAISATDFDIDIGVPILL